MRIYGLFDTFDEDYYDQILLKMSTKPFEEKCYYLDFNENNCYDCFFPEGEEVKDWKIYNGVERLGNFLYNPETKEYINSRIVDECFGQGEDWVELEDGRRFDEDGCDSKYSTYAGGYQSEWTMYQEYKNGEPVGKPIFKVL